MSFCFVQRHILQCNIIAFLIVVPWVGFHLSVTIIWLIDDLNVLVCLTLRASSQEDLNEPVKHTGILKLRGLPFSATKEDIIEFFNGFVVSEDSINITFMPDGRPTGEAFVEFASAEDSEAAMERDRKTLGSRYIELFASSQEELNEALSKGQ